MNYKAVVIDDNPSMRDNNRNIVQKGFTEISLVGEASSVSEGIKLINREKPDLVLLDIELEGGTGFDILQQVNHSSFALIFITAFNDYAIKAIKFSALDYVLKPVDEDELVSAVHKALEQLSINRLETQVKVFMEHYEKSTQIKKVVLKTSTDLHIVNLHDITYCKSDNNYTKFYFKSESPITVSKGMKEYEKLFSDYGFIRPHNSFLVNLNYITKLDKTDGGFLIMQDNTEIPVSVRRKAKLLQIFDSF